MRVCMSNPLPTAPKLNHPAHQHPRGLHWPGASIVFIALATLGSACGPPKPPLPDAGPCALEASWGREPGCSFQPFADGQKAEITLGFQGFRFIESAARLTGTSEPMGKLVFGLTIEGQPTSVQSSQTVELRQGPDGALYAHQVLVFLNDIPLAELIGRRAEVTLGATAGACRAQHKVSVTLVDDDLSIQGADAGFQCPDAG